MEKFLECVLLSLALSLAACENDAYDTGDGALSAMRADFVEAHTDANARMDSIATDDGERLAVASPVAVSWMEKPDTFYRALLYYNKVDGSGGEPEASPVGIAQVFVPPVVPAASVAGGVKTDPVSFVSSWKSANGKYLNLEFLVKTGTVDGSYGTQSVGMVCDSTAVGADGGSCVYLTLYHDQGGVPEYYSAEVYVSIPVGRLPVEAVAGGTVSVNINTYGGVVTRTFYL